jgi:type III secretion protein S
VDQFLVKINESILLVLLVSGPVLAVAVAVGLLVGLAQALTQIQDQTLPQAIKLVVVLIVIIMLGPIFAKKIADQASAMLDEFPVMTR